MARTEYDGRETTDNGQAGVMNSGTTKQFPRKCEETEYQAAGPNHESHGLLRWNSSPPGTQESG